MKRATINFYDACNYNCPFCYLGPRKHSSDLGRLATREGMKLLVDFFRPDNEWELFLGGGEISIHPYFQELCQKITERHYLSFQTNLSFDVKSFVSAVPAERVKGISATLQPQGESDLDAFTGKVLTLRDEGIHVGLVYICTPERIAGIPELFRRFCDRGLHISMQGLIGSYRGKNYPDDYTDGERKVIREHSISYASILNLDLHQISYPRGELCSAGYSRVKINGKTGVIKPCDALPPIGNLYDGEMRLYPEPIRCPMRTCNCELFDELSDFFYRELARYYTQRMPIPETAWQEFIKRATRNKENNEFGFDTLGGKIGGRPLYVWGAGQAGRAFVNRLKQAGVEIQGLIDNDTQKQGTNLGGIRIVAPGELDRQKSIRPFIVIASCYAHEIELQLRQKGLKYDTDYRYA